MNSTNAGNQVSNQSGKWALFWVCGSCGEPTCTFDICNELGYNPGVDGHMFKSEDEALTALQLTIDSFIQNHEFSKNPKFKYAVEAFSLSQFGDWLRTSVVPRFVQF